MKMLRSWLAPACVALFALSCQKSDPAPDSVLVPGGSLRVLVNGKDSTSILQRLNIASPWNRNTSTASNGCREDRYSLSNVRRDTSWNSLLSLTQCNDEPDSLITLTLEQIYLSKNDNPITWPDSVQRARYVNRPFDIPWMNGTFVIRNNANNQLHLRRRDSIQVDLYMNVLK